MQHIQIHVGATSHHKTETIRYTQAPPQYVCNTVNHLYSPKLNVT